MRQRALPWHSFLPCHANRQQKHNCFLCQGPGNRYEAAKQLLYSPVFFHFQRRAVLFKCHHFFPLFPLEKLPRLVLWCCFTYVVQPGPAHVPLCIHQLSPHANKRIMCVISDSAQEIRPVTGLSLQPFAQMSSIKHSFHTSSPCTQERGTPALLTKPLFSLHTRRITQIFIVAHKNRLILPLVSLAPFLYKGVLF